MHLMGSMGKSHARITKARTRLLDPVRKELVNRANEVPGNFACCSQPLIIRAQHAIEAWYVIEIGPALRNDKRR